MTSALHLALAACGLSQREAAEYLGVRRDTVAKAMVSRIPTPPGWMRELRALHDKLSAAADEALRAIPDDFVGLVEFGLAADDHEARMLGIPCVGAHRAVLRMIWEAGYNVHPTPSGLKEGILPPAPIQAGRGTPPR